VVREGRTPRLLLLLFFFYLQGSRTKRFSTEQPQAQYILPLQYRDGLKMSTAEPSSDGRK
jgi:hypothetical protein